MSAPPLELPPSHSTSGHHDGLGTRTLRFDREDGLILERLHVRPELVAFEGPLRERMGRAMAFEDERFARVRAIERDPGGGLTVVSEFVAGNRVCDLLEAAAGLSAEDATSLSVDAALGFLLEMLPALAALHSIAGFIHGAVGPDRTVLTPTGQVVLLDSIFGHTLERLHFNRRRLWTELRIAAPAAAGPTRFDIAADLGQASITGVMIVLGRPLKDSEYPDSLPALVAEVVEIAQIRGSAKFATGLHRFLERTLPIPGRKPYASADEAAAELRQLAREIGIDRCRAALVAFVDDMTRNLAAAEMASAAHGEFASAFETGADEFEPAFDDEATSGGAEDDAEEVVLAAAEDANTISFELLGSFAPEAPAPAEEAAAPITYEPEPEPYVAYEPEPVVEPYVAYTPEPVAEPYVPYTPEPVAEPYVPYVPEPVAEPYVPYVPEAVAEPYVPYTPEPVAEPYVPYEPEPVAEPYVPYEPEVVAETYSTPEPEPEPESYAAYVPAVEPVPEEVVARAEVAPPTPDESARVMIGRDEVRELAVGREIELVRERFAMEAERVPEPRIAFDESFPDPKIQQPSSEPLLALQQETAAWRAAFVSLDEEAAPAAPPAPPPPPAPEPVAEPEPPAASARKRKRGAKADRDKLRSNAPVRPAPIAVPPPIVPMAPIHLVPVQMPAPLYVPPVMPVYGRGGQESTYGRSEMRLDAPVQAAPAPAIVAPPPAAIGLRIKADFPSGYTPVPTRSDRRESRSGMTALPYVERGAPPSVPGFSWKVAAGTAVLALVGVGAGVAFWATRKPAAPPVQTVATKPAVAAPVTVRTGSLGSIVIETQPTGAKVLLDGKEKGESPVTLEGVAPGRHTLTFITPTITVKKTVRVEAGKALVLDVPIYSAWVTVFSTIPIDISENGKAIGTSEQGGLNFSPGAHVLTFSSRDYGYSAAQTVQLEPGENRTINLRPTGEINLNASPDWAEIWIDGKKIEGGTPIARLQVPLGTHEIVFKHQKLGERRLTAVVKASAPVHISVDFNKPSLP